MTNRSIKLTALLLLIAAAAAWWWLRRRGVIDTPHGRVKLERSARVRNASAASGRQRRFEMARFKLKWWGLEYIGMGTVGGSGVTLVDEINDEEEARAYAENETIARLQHLRARGHNLPAWACHKLEEREGDLK